MAVEPVLEVRNLHVSYGSYEGRLRVLDGVELELYEGERVGLVGETGCGKTTTMKSILRLLPPNGRIDEGSIRLRGTETLGLTEDEMGGLRGAQATAIFENPSAALNPVFTVGQQLGEVITQRIHHSQNRSPDSGEVLRAAVQALRDVSLPDPERLLRSYPLELSGGMKQRVCIALALAALGGEGAVLLADEPGTALDVTIQDQILRLLNSIVTTHHLALLHIEHSLAVVREWTDRLYVMYAGTTVEQAPTRQLFANPVHPYTLGLLAAVPRLTGGGLAQGIPGRMPDYTHPPRGCRYYPRCPFRMDMCLEAPPRLREVEPGHQVACYRSV